MSRPLAHAIPFTAGGDVASATTVAYGTAEAGRILNNSGAAQTLTVYEAAKAGATYVLCDDVGTNGVLPELADGESVELPTKLRGSNFLKFVVDNTSLPELTLVAKG